MRTIFNRTKRKREPAFAIVMGDGRGYRYDYEICATPKDRERVESHRDGVLYRVNIWPKVRNTRTEP